MIYKYLSCVAASGLTIGQYMPEEFRQHWMIPGDYIRQSDREDRVLEVKDGNMEDGADVVVAEHDGTDGQQWEKDYVYVFSVTHCETWFYCIGCVMPITVLASH